MARTVWVKPCARISTARFVASSVRHCNFRRIEREDELEAALERFVILHQARWQSKGETGFFALPRFRDFLGEVMRLKPREGRLRLWTLEVEGESRGRLAGFLRKRRRALFPGRLQSGFAKESLGTVMIGLCLKDCVEADEVKEFDFMGGEATISHIGRKRARETIELEWIRQGIRSLITWPASGGIH